MAKPIISAPPSIRLPSGEATGSLGSRNDIALFDVLNRTRLHKMFKFIKQLLSPAARPTTQSTTRKPEGRKQQAWDPTESIPASEVLEGNDNTDWDLWQCSVDSQMQPLTPAVKVKANATPSQLDELDPFARVSKNSDL